MRTNDLLIVLVALATATGGCVADTQAKTESTAAPQAPEAADPARFDENTGAIQGLVTDDQIQPIAGAQVGLLDVDKSTLTDKAGAFTLSNVAPGEHTVAVQALGYESTGRKVSVVAGEVVTLQIALPPVPVVEPYLEVKLFNGYISCTFAVVRTTLAASCPGTASSTKNTQEIYPSGWPTTWNATLVEADWKFQDFLAFDYNDRGIGYYGVYYRVRDETPVRFLVERCHSYVGPPWFGRAPPPCTEEEVAASKMHVETFYVGRFQNEAHNLDAVCRENLTAGGVSVLPGYQAGCYGAGVATELRWTNYVSVFHLELPPDVDAYSARPDG